MSRCADFSVPGGRKAELKLLAIEGAPAPEMLVLLE
jgi:hypothetical protein